MNGTPDEAKYPHDETEAFIDDWARSLEEANSDYREAVARSKATRAIGFLEGFGALLWTQVGPNLADDEVVEFEKRVAEIAAYIGLPPREVDAE